MTLSRFYGEFYTIFYLFLVFFLAKASFLDSNMCMVILKGLWERVFLLPLYMDGFILIGPMHIFLVV